MAVNSYIFNSNQLTMKKYLIIISIGFLIVFAGDLLIGKTLKYFYFKTSSGLLQRTTYSIEKTEADILIFGTSRANHHYDVKLIEEQTGLSAYNTGRDGNFIFYQTAILKSILKRYTPNQIILDFTGTFEFRQEDYDRLSSLLPYYDSHPEIHDIVELKSTFEQYKLKSQIYPYNSLLTTIAIGNLEYNKNRGKNKGAYKGFVPLGSIWENNLDSVEIKKHYEIDYNKQIVFEEFIKLSCDKEIPLVVVYSPVYYQYEKDYSIDICKGICEKYNVNFIDYSKDSDFLKNRNLFQDKSHLNSNGAKLLTTKVLKSIKNEG